MKTLRIFGLFVLLAAGYFSSATPARAEEKGSQFEALKKLAGEWTAKANHAGMEQETTIVYKLTAGGSVVEEIEFGGTEHEMVTMYHQSGDDLVLTHYCMLGNQPRMKAAAGKAENKIVFEFDGGGNIKPEKDMHMHNMTLEIIDPDHIKATWTLFKDGNVDGGHCYRYEAQEEVGKASQGAPLYSARSACGS